MLICALSPTLTEVGDRAVHALPLLRLADTASLDRLDSRMRQIKTASQKEESET